MDNKLKGFLAPGLLQPQLQPGAHDGPRMRGSSSQTCDHRVSFLRSTPDTMGPPPHHGETMSGRTWVGIPVPFILSVGISVCNAHAGLDPRV